MKLSKLRRPKSNNFSIILSKLHKRYKILFIASILIVGSLTWILTQSESSNKHLNTKNQPSSETLFKYDTFVTIWNDFAIKANARDKYFLPASKPEKTIQKLNRFLVLLNLESNRQLLQEYKTISSKSKYSLPALHYEFLKKYQLKFVAFNSSDDSIEIKNRLAKIFHENSFGYSTVIKVISLNDPCFFLSSFLNSLHSQGLDRNIVDCSGIQVDPSDYPNIHSMLYQTTVYLNNHSKIFK